MVALMSKKKGFFLAISVALLLSLIGGVLFAQATQKDNVYRYLSIFTEVYDLVQNNYVEPVSSDQLMNGAFNGVTDAIDEFSYYVPPSAIAAYRDYKPDSDNGIGLVVSKRFGYAYIISAIPGSPAAKAGIERGDFVELVDGKPTTKMPIWQVRSLIDSGKSVHLQILRGGQTKRDEFTIAPAKFHPLALTTKQYGNVAYVAIPYFEHGTAAQLATELAAIRKNGERKLIVDLRGNAGGDVDEAIKSADELLTSGLITSLKGQTISGQQWQADRATDYDGDVEVLIDNSTASGAEIFAAAIEGNGRGKTVGVNTYGKAIYQRFISLPSGGGVQMTVGHYTMPDLKPIKEGIRPDVLVDLTPQLLEEHDATKPQQPEEDLILEKALAMYGEPVTILKKAA